MSEGKLPSAALRRWTTSHSRPLAECTVEMTSQSSSIDGCPARSPVELRRLEREVGGDVGQARRAVGRGHERVEIGEPRLGVVVGVLDQRRRARRAGARRAAPTDSPVAARTRRDERVGVRPSGGGELLDGERPAQQHLGRGARFVDAERGDRPGGRSRDRRRSSSWSSRNQASSSRGLSARRNEADQVLDVGGLEEAQPAVLHVGDAPPRQLELEQVAVVRGADEHRLLAQRDALFAMGEDPLAHRVDLGVLVGAPHELRPFAARRRRPAAAP